MCSIQAGMSMIKCNSGFKCGEFQEEFYIQPENLSGPNGLLIMACFSHVTQWINNFSEDSFVNLAACVNHVRKAWILSAKIFFFSENIPLDI